MSTRPPSTRSVSALGRRSDGSAARREALARSPGGRVLNSTNDVIAARDGTGPFTDPPFGVRAEAATSTATSKAMGLPFCGTFRVTRDPDAPELLADAVHRPNGLCLSPDELVLYVGDSSERHRKVLAFGRPEAASASVPPACVAGAIGRSGPRTSVPGVCR